MAEEIGYSIAGGQSKQLDNVIDYNIREEQTKDAFNTQNANNQTTTGMANVIPGVNAPKLIASTSVIGSGGGGAGGTPIITLTDITSTGEWQPAVDKVLNGEHICVSAKVPAYSNYIYIYFTPCKRDSNGISFGGIIQGSPLYLFRVNCDIYLTTVISVTVQFTTI